MTERYSFSLTTFSPSGKLVQIEYALNAVAAGAASIAIKAKDAVVLAAENKTSPLVDETSIQKIAKITNHIGMTYSGLGPDFRILVDSARKRAQVYQLQYGEEISPSMLVQQVAAMMQEYTQSGGVRPFGVSLLIAGWNLSDKTPHPELYQCDPSGAYYPWKATALGKNYINSRTFLEKRYNEELEQDDAIHTALLTMKESFDVEMNEKNVQIAIVNKDGYQFLTQSNIKDFISTL